MHQAAATGVQVHSRFIHLRFSCDKDEAVAALAGPLNLLLHMCEHLQFLSNPRPLAYAEPLLRPQPSLLRLDRWECGAAPVFFYCFPGLAA